MKRPTGSTMTKVGVEDLIRDSTEKPQNRREICRVYLWLRGGESQFDKGQESCTVFDLA